jgi:hypothetical protein
MSKKAIGWSMFETIAVGLINCIKCEHCNNIIHYNGIPPRYCHCCVMEEEVFNIFGECIVDDLKYAKTQVIK